MNNAQKALKPNVDLKRGRINAKYGPGRPFSMSTRENVDAVREIILDHRQVKLKCIAEALNISYESVFDIVHSDMGMRKLSAKSIPKCLDTNQKLLTTSKLIYSRFEKNSSF